LLPADINRIALGLEYLSAKVERLIDTDNLIQSGIGSTILGIPILGHKK
jgi:hypothetical protein